MTILVVNSSPNHHGNTIDMAEEFLEGQSYEILNLNDYDLAQLGQSKDWDQFDQIFAKIDQADTVVFGTPIYWHDMTGSLKLLVDRMSEDVDWESSHMAGKRVILIAQGAAPSGTVLKHCDFMFQRFCSLTGLNYLGMVSTMSQVPKFKKKVDF